MLPVEKKALPLHSVVGFASNEGHIMQEKERWTKRILSISNDGGQITFKYKNG